MIILDEDDIDVQRGTFTGLYTEKKEVFIEVRKKIFISQN